MTDMSGLTVFLMGGWTDEAEVSRNTAKTCFQAAQDAGWTCELIEVEHDIASRLAELKPRRAFNALHGQLGEDGNMQGMLNLMGIPYTHSGVLASAVAMDKPMTKTVLGQSGIRFADDIPIRISGGIITPDQDTAPRSPYSPTPFSMVIKPRNTGSSVGVHIWHDGDDLPQQNLWPEDTHLMAERFIPGRELTVSVLHGEPLTVTEIIQTNRFYDYEAKYADGGSTHIFPADIDSDVFATAMEWAAIAHDQLGCRGISRSDFRFNDATGELIMLELNTQPGMTNTSLVPEQAGYKGISMGALVSSLLEAAQCD